MQRKFQIHRQKRRLASRTMNLGPSRPTYTKAINVLQVGTVELQAYIAGSWGGVELCPFPRAKRCM